MAAPIEFESQVELRRKRDEKRQAQAVILQEAKAIYDKKERRKEAHRLKGDDKWMLTSVTDRIQAEGEQLKSKKHKKEKKKKKKRTKEKKSKQKHKHRETKSESSSDDEDDSDEMQWVESTSTSSTATKQNTDTPQKQTKTTQREDWMSNPFDLATFSRDDVRKEKASKMDKETEKEKEDRMILDTPGQSEREINPFWKDGGKGLPEAKRNLPAVKSGIADGGAGWLRRAFQRIVERSGEEGRSVADLAAEKWGSLEKYHELLAKAEGEDDRQRHRDRDRPRHNRDTHRDTHPRGERDEGKAREPQSNRHKDRDYGRDSDRDYGRGRDYRHHDRPGGPRSRSPERDSDRTRDRHRDTRGGESKSLSGRTFMRPGDSDERTSGKLKSFEGMRGMFKKPGDETSDRNISRRDRYRDDDRRREDGPTPGWKKKTFIRPNEDSERSPKISSSRASPPSSSRTSSSSSGTPSWKKKSSVKPNESEKTSTAIVDKPSARPPTSESSSSSSESDSSSDTEGEKSPSPPPRSLSEAEMNQLGAKIVRAELMGNEDLAKRLKAQLEGGRQAKAAQTTKGPERKGQQAQGSKTSKEAGSENEQEEVVLTLTDRTGQSWPVPEQTGLESNDKGRKRKKKKQIMVTHDKDGKRERYFGDDDQQELKDMVRKERMTSSQDQLKMFNKVANKALEKLTEDYTLDDMFVSTAAQKGSSGQEGSRDRAAAIKQHRSMAASLANCPYCLDSTIMQKHLIIALGIKVYLCVPANQSLTEGHCFIIPMHHTSSSTAVDEDVWSEIQIYRKGLTKMFEDQDKDAIFLETCMKARSQRHMVIECVPVPKEIGDMAPIYFKKAIQESESEWTQNKKLVDTRQKNIRKSIPQGFPYFSVDFGLDGGFAHVIEDEDVFPHYFGKEVVGGMMDLEPHLWRRPHKQNFDDQRRKVLQFGEWWKPFDWTQKIGK
ncbi:CWF19-like protein 2 [Asterias rubens]|uniref:CWF19-like protein 2 n=1 Tax=Asterias rubens TaxID=7604 RepID=UPI001454EB5C|nr:CWF19-like protein 2 [Asterias rubens]